MVCYLSAVFLFPVHGVFNLFVRFSPENQPTNSSVLPAAGGIVPGSELATRFERLSKFSQMTMRLTEPLFWKSFFLSSHGCDVFHGIGSTGANAWHSLAVSLGVMANP